MENTENKILSLFNAFDNMKALGYEVYLFQLHFDTRTINKLIKDIPSDTIMFDVDSLNMSLHTNNVRFLYNGNIEELEIVLNQNGIEIDVIQDKMVWFTIEDITDIQSFFDIAQID